jgi:hypothetical protein
MSEKRTVWVHFHSECGEWSEWQLHEVVVDFSDNESRIRREREFEDSARSTHEQFCGRSTCVATAFVDWFDTEDHSKS